MAEEEGQEVVFVEKKDRTDEYVNPIPNSFRYTKGNGISLEDVCVAACQGNFEKLEEYLSTGDADNIFNDDLNMFYTDITALHIAAMSGHVDCVKLLLEAGADPHIKKRCNEGVDPKTGHTALDSARKFKHDEVAKILEEAEKNTPLGWYVPEGIANNKKLYSEPDPNTIWQLTPTRAEIEAKQAAAKAKPKAQPKPIEEAKPAAAAEAKPAEAAAPSTEPPLPVALLFPGQGSQYVKMLDGAKDIPEVKDMLATAKDVLGYDLLDLCLNGPEEKLAETKYCQPAMFVGGLAAVAKLKAEKPEAVSRAKAVAGLSLGEYTALCAAGVLSFEDGLKLVKLRGEAMQEAASVGKQGMISVVGLEEKKLAELCDKAAASAGEGGVCKIANHLFPKGFSCAGTDEAVKALEKLATDGGALQAKVLKTSGAFHTSLMKPAEEKLIKALDEAFTKMKPPRCAVYMNVTGEALPAGSDPKRFLELMQKQLTSPVLWTPSVSAMMKDGVTQFYECGPMKQIKAMMKRIDMAVWKETTNVEV